MLTRSNRRLSQAHPGLRWLAVADPDPFLALVADTLRCDYHAGAVTAVDDGFTTGWRVMDTATVAQIRGGRFRVEVDGAEPVEINDGDGNCVRAGLRHRISAISGPGVISSWSHVQFTIFGACDVLQLFAPSIALPPAIADEIGVANAQLAELHRQPITTIPQTLRRSCLGLRLLDAIVREREFRGDELERLRAIQRIGDALERIHARLDQPPTVAELARRMRLSPARFHALFKQAMGVAPSDYARSARIQRARQLLMHGALSIAEVARRVGFASPFHFSRAFKQATGLSPTRWRRLAIDTKRD